MYNKIRIALIEYVTPLAGVWIEIRKKLKKHLPESVTPLAGVWIEM